MLFRIQYELIVQCYIFEDYTSTVPCTLIVGVAKDRLKRDHVMKRSDDGSYRYLRKSVSYKVYSSMVRYGAIIRSGRA